MNRQRFTSRIIKWLLQLQIFLLRRQWGGPLNGSVMIITTTGRKSGKSFSTPIGFARDGKNVLAFNLKGQPNWYKNMLANPQVTLEVQKQKLVARGEAVLSSDEKRHILDLYKQQRPESFTRFFKVPIDSATDEIIPQLEGRIQFVRFTPLV